MATPAPPPAQVRAQRRLPASCNVRTQVCNARSTHACHILCYTPAACPPPDTRWLLHQTALLAVDAARSCAALAGQPGCRRSCRCGRAAGLARRRCMYACMLADAGRCLPTAVSSTPVECKEAASFAGSSCCNSLALHHCRSHAALRQEVGCADADDAAAANHHALRLLAITAACLRHCCARSAGPLAPRCARPQQHLVL